MRWQTQLTLMVLALMALLAGGARAATARITDAGCGISYAVPPGWRSIQRLGTTSAMVSPDERASVTVAFARANPNTLEMISQEFLKAGPRNFRDFQLIALERMTLRGKEALRVVFDFKIGYPFRQKHLKIPRPGGYIDVVFSASIEDWSRYEPDFNGIESSFAFYF